MKELSRESLLVRLKLQQTQILKLKNSIQVIRDRELRLRKENYRLKMEKINPDFKEKIIVTSTDLKDMVYKLLCEQYGIDISVRTRELIYVRARAIYFYYLKMNTKYSLKKLGSSLPNLQLDHSTVIHAVRVFEDEFETSKSFRAEFATFEKEIMRRINQVECNPSDREHIAQAHLTAN